jgi:hypothetical protein
MKQSALRLLNVKSWGLNPSKHFFDGETLKTFNCNQASVCVIASEILDNSSDGPKHVAV